MFFMTITATGAAKKIAAGYAAKAIGQAEAEAVKRLLIFMHKLAFKKAPYMFGILRREIKPIFEKRMLVAGTHLSKKYAPIQEFGGTIKPKKPGGWLIWQDRKTKKWHRAKKVTIKPKHYFRDTANESTAEAEKIYKEEYEKAFS